MGFALRGSEPPESSRRRHLNFCSVESFGNPTNREICAGKSSRGFVEKPKLPMEELGNPNGGRCFRNSIHGGAKNPLWGRTGATAPGLGLETVNESKNNQKSQREARADPAPGRRSRFVCGVGWEGGNANSSWILGNSDENPAGNAGTQSWGGTSGVSLSKVFMNFVISPIPGSLSPGRGRDSRRAPPDPALVPFPPGFLSLPNESN